MNQKAILILLLMTLFLSFPVHAQDNEVSVLVMYTTNSELDYINSFLPSLENLEITTVTDEFVTVPQIQQQDMILLLGSEQFSFNEDIEDGLTSFVQESGNSLITITPFLGELSGSLRTLIGVDNFDKEFPEENTTNWTVNLNQDVGEFVMGEDFNYSGAIGLFETSSEVIAEVVDSSLSPEDEGDLTYPYPLIVNASTSSTQIITMGMGVEDTYEEGEGIQLSQLPSFIDMLVIQLIESAVNIYQSGFIDTSAGTNPSSVNTNPTSSSTTDNGGVLPNLPSINSLYPLLAVISVFLILIFSKVLGVIDWISRRLYTVLIFIVGAFYNIQERSLDYNEVMYNQARVEIISFLEHIGRYGAHLREIKTITNLGSGSLLWHLQVLEDFNIVEKIKVDSYTVFVITDSSHLFEFDVKEIELQLQSKYTFPVLEVLNEYSTQSQIDLSTVELETGINRRTLRRLIRKMEILELVEIISGPSFSLNIKNKDLLSKLYTSFRLRNSFDPSEFGVTITSLDE